MEKSIKWLSSFQTPLFSPEVAMVTSCVCTCAKLLQARAVDGCFHTSWVPSSSRSLPPSPSVWVVWVFHEKLPGHSGDLRMVCSPWLRLWSLVFKKTLQPKPTIWGYIFANLRLQDWEELKVLTWEWSHMFFLPSDLGQMLVLWASVSSSVKWGDVDLHREHRKLPF